MRKAKNPILNAVNSQGIIRAIVPEAAANARMVEGVMTIPYGLWPVEITNEDGKSERVLQRLDKAVAGRLVSAFNGLTGRLARFVSGCPIYMGHPDHVGAKTTAAWARLGRCIAMAAGEDALTVTGDCSADAKALLAANSTLAPSPHWGLRRTSESQDGLAICEPVAFYSMGITARPNIAGAAVNEDATDPATVGLMDQAERDRQISILAAEIAGMETDLQSARAELDASRVSCTTLTTERNAMQAHLCERDLTIAALKTDLAALRAELDACRAALEASKSEAAGYTAAANAHIAAALDAAGIIPADREHWAGKLRTTPAAVNELFVTARSIKTESVVSAARMAAANEALGGVTAASRFAQVVRERMAGTKEDWPTAWNACRGLHRELFNLMPNGGKA